MFKLEIETDGAAFCNPDTGSKDDLFWEGVEINRLLEKVQIEIEEGYLGTGIVDLLVEKGVMKTKSEGRRLVQQNGLSVNDEKVKDFAMPITRELFKDNEFLVKMGKKKFYKVVLK